MSWVSELHKGTGRRVNKGLRAATGAIIGWANSDDVPRVSRGDPLGPYTDQ
jgi:hypothetical protein